MLLCSNCMLLCAAIHQSTSWARLQEHANEIKQLHLRDLMNDSQRCGSLYAEYDGIALDYSRQNVTATTMVRMHITQQTPLKLLFYRIFSLIWLQLLAWTLKERQWGVEIT